MTINRNCRTILILALLSALAGGCAKSDNNPSPSQGSESPSGDEYLQAYPGITSIDTSGTYAVTSTTISCSAACTVNYDTTVNVMEEFSSINCEGSLTVNDNSLVCTSALNLVKSGS